MYLSPFYFCCSIVTLVVCKLLQLQGSISTPKMKSSWTTGHDQRSLVSCESVPCHLRRVVSLGHVNSDCLPLGGKEAPRCKEVLDVLFALS